LHQWLLILGISLEKWLIFGQRKEVDSAPLTTAIVNAENGWLPIWIGTFIIILEDTPHGKKGTVFHIL
jgi:hypothetical protein